MVLEGQARAPKQTQAVYVPPARRSENGSSIGGPNSNRATPQKNRQSLDNEVKEGIVLLPPPPNCCEDDELEIEETPKKRLQNSPDPRNSDPRNRFANQAFSQQTGNRKEAKKKEENIAVTSRFIKCQKPPQLQLQPESRAESQLSPKREPEQDVVQLVETRQVATVATSNKFTSRNDSWKPGTPSKKDRVKSEIEQFHENTVPYIDSHCHTDFISGMLNRNRVADGIAYFVKKVPLAFPKSLAGIIANFIQPSLYVSTPDTQKCYDLEWIRNELQSSSLYLGTTWGCHPHHAQKWAQSQDFWETLEEVLLNKEKWKVVAVGEAGIDQHRCESDLETQKNVFKRHVELAFEHRLPLIVHCRSGSRGNSEDICLNIITEQMKQNHPFLTVHRHCFTESWDVAKKWLTACPNVVFGFTGGVFSFRANQLEAIRRIPLDRILLETDAPYFKPKSFDNIGTYRCCLPGMAIATAYKIAEIKGLPPAEVLRATYNNTRRVYQLPLF